MSYVISCYNKSYKKAQLYGLLILNTLEKSLRKYNVNKKHALFVNNYFTETLDSNWYYEILFS